LNGSTFLTSDGYRLFKVGGEWVDSTDPEFVDLRFESDRRGFPLDCFGEPLEEREEK
jgi:hypothetical protein